jgi:hypothetical protein
MARAGRFAPTHCGNAGRAVRSVPDGSRRVALRSPRPRGRSLWLSLITAMTAVPMHILADEADTVCATVALEEGDLRPDQVKLIAKRLGGKRSLDHTVLTA